jgi:PemK-like, MazF-like toxin of type II toxin-antitoxin system
VNFPSPDPRPCHPPFVGLDEFRAEHEEGVKDRPCAIVLNLVDDEGETRVTVVPITHTPHADPATAIELPIDTKNRLGLDADRSWIVLSEGNDFLWHTSDRDHGAGLAARAWRACDLRA